MIKILLLILLLPTFCFANPILDEEARLARAFKFIDYQAGSETDSAGDVSIDTNTKFTVSTMARTANSWTYQSRNISGDFVFRFKFNISAVSGNSAWGSPLFLTTDQNGTVQDISSLSNPDDRRMEFVLGTSSGTPNVVLYVDNGAGGIDSDSFTPSTSTDYYVEIRRVNGQFTGYIYSDANFTTLVDTLDATATTWSDNIGVVQYAVSRDNTGTDSISYTAENLQLKVG